MLEDKNVLVLLASITTGSTVEKAMRCVCYYGGSVAGVAMKAWGYKNGQCVIEMDHPQQIEPEQVGVQTGDYVIINGTPAVNMLNSPEIDGGIGTIAMCVNMIPQIINAEPGLHTMLTLPVPRAIMGDMRDRIDPSRKIVK